jgi:hypothetical protein
MVASTQAAYTEALSGFAALMSAKTLGVRIELQVNLVRTSTIWAIAEGRRCTKASFDLAQKASSPLIAHAACAAEMFPVFKA